MDTTRPLGHDRGGFFESQQIPTQHLFCIAYAGRGRCGVGRACADGGTMQPDAPNLWPRTHVFLFGPFALGPLVGQRLRVVVVWVIARTKYRIIVDCDHPYFLVGPCCIVVAHLYSLGRLQACTPGSEMASVLVGSLVMVDSR